MCLSLWNGMGILWTIKQIRINLEQRKGRKTVRKGSQHTTRDMKGTRYIEPRKKEYACLPFKRKEGTIL